MLFFLKGIIIGFVCGIPVGAIGTLCIRRSLAYGFRSGLMTGFGSSVADSFYAVVSIFGISLISDIITKYQTFIDVIGGILIILMGINAIRKREDHSAVQKKKPNHAVMFLSSLGIGLINPAVFIMLMFVCSYVGINGDIGIFGSVMAVLGVFAGTMIWWFILSSISGMISRKYGSKGFAGINTVFGSIMIGFGALVFVKMIF